jgi:hypothetical protein
VPDDGQEVPDDGLYTHQNLRLVEGFPKLALALLGTTAKTTPKLSTPPEVLVSGLLST